MASLHVRLLLPLDLGPSGQHRQLRGKGHRRMQRGDCRLATAVPLFLPMPKSKFYAPNFYAGVPLDRADRLRADAERLAAFLRDPESRVVPLWRNRHLIAAESEAVVCRLGEIDSLLGGAGETTFLGRRETAAYLAVDFSALAERSEERRVGGEGV